MTIKREVNGEMMEFELTRNEMSAAFTEWEHVWDMKDVRSFHEDEDLEMPDNVVSEIADTARDMMNNSDTYMNEWWECVRAAYKEVVGNDD